MNYLAAAIVALSVAICFLIYVEQKECEAQGKAFVRTVSWFECVKR